MERIVTCGCGDTNAFVKEAYKLLFPGSPLPPITTAEDLVNTTGPYSQSRRELQAMQKAKQKFAYLFRDEELWDLLKGVRVG